MVLLEIFVSELGISTKEGSLYQMHGALIGDQSLHPPDIISTLYPPRLRTLHAKEASLPWDIVKLLMDPMNSGERPVAAENIE